MLQTFEIHKLAQPLEDLFDTHFRDGRPRSFINTGNGGSGLSGKFFASRLLKAAAETEDIPALLNGIENALCTKTAEATCVVVLWGINCEAVTQIDTQIDLLPFDKLPNSPQKEAIIRAQFNRNATVQFSAFPTFNQPSAALVGRCQISQVILSATEVDDSSIDKLASFRMDQRLNQLAKILTLCQPSSVIAGSRWMQFEDEYLSILNFSGTSFGHVEILPMHAKSSGVFNANKAQHLWSNYQGLKSHQRDRVDVAIDHISRAMRRSSPSDAAVELVTVMDCVTGTSKAKLSQHRIAHVVGKTSKRRAAIQHLLGDVYKIRNKKIHTGKSSTKVAGRAPHISPDSVVNAAIRICVRAVVNTLQSRSFAKLQIGAPTRTEYLAYWLRYWGRHLIAAFPYLKNN